MTYFNSLSLKNTILSITIIALSSFSMPLFAQTVVGSGSPTQPTQKLSSPQAKTAPGFTIGASIPGLIPNVDYKDLKPTNPLPKYSRNDRLTVFQFFNYACATCYEAEQKLKEQAAQLQQHVKIIRVPTTLTPESGILARVYFALDATAFNERVHEAFYKAKLEENKNFADLATLIDIVKPLTNETYAYHFQQAVKHNVATAARTQHAHIYQQELGINAAPSFVVDNRFLVLAKTPAELPGQILKISNALKR